jgi:hypothetical protein
MGAVEYRAALQKLGVSQGGDASAQQDVPAPIAKLIRLWWRRYFPVVQ